MVDTWHFDTPTLWDLIYTLINSQTFQKLTMHLTEVSNFMNLNFHESHGVCETSENEVS